MKLLADENIEVAVVKRLRACGYDVLYILESSPGISDLEVLSIAQAESRILITGDKDFGELVYRYHQATPGVLFIRLPELRLTEKSEVVIEALKNHILDMKGSFSIISHMGIRIRKLKLGNTLPQLEDPKQ